MKVFVDQLDMLALWDSTNCIFVVSSNIQIQKENVYRIPLKYTESQHFIAASDLVITKAGWSTIAEAINLNKPLNVLKRGNMEEDRNTIQYLKNNQRAEIMDWPQIINLTIDENTLKQFNKQKDNHSVDNDSSKIAEKS